MAIRHRDLLMSLEQLMPRTRNSRFVGHDFRHELGILQSFKFDLHITIAGNQDTKKIASEGMPDTSITRSETHEEIQLSCDGGESHQARPWDMGI